MDHFELDQGPIVVAGAGGSGTRLAARLLLELGFHLGDDLNASLDNLWFTLLLMRPRWFGATADEVSAEAEPALRVLGRALRGEALSPEDVALATGAAEEAHESGYTLAPQGAGTGDWGVGAGQSWARTRLRSLLDSRRRAKERAAGPDPGGNAPARRFAGWGWKEPNSHVFLPELTRTFDRMRFILVVRHGLDMAFSGNRSQLINWGSRFAIDAPASGRDVPRRMLDFWVAVNERAIRYGTTHLPDRFLLLNYDRLCRSPHAEVKRLCAFVERDPAPGLLERLARIPRPPASMGRYRGRVEQFDAEQLDAVRGLGFEI